MPMKERIGLIAGSGQFPVIFSRKARSGGYEVYAAAYVNEADETLKEYVDTIEWMNPGQVNRLIRFFKKNGVSRAVMMGGIQKTRIFRDIRPDFRAISMMIGMKNSHDDGVLRAFANVLEKEGIQVLASTFLVPELLAPEGCWTLKKPTRSQYKDMALGWRIAKEIGKLDIGQCVVVGGGSVLAVEAIDGTDATIRRGGALGKDTVVVKVCKPNQDFRFDVPATGVKTIETMAEANAVVLLLEAEKAVVFDREEMISLANQKGIAIVAAKKFI